MNATAGSLQVINGGAMPTLNLSNDQKLHAVRQTVAKNASDEEFAMFMHLANTYQLDPFLKEIWFIKYNSNSPTIMVSRDGLRNYAQRQGDMLGLISQEVRQGDMFKLNPITGDIHHEISDGSGPITKAYAIVKRDGKPDHIEVVDFMEYFNALSGKNPVWKSHPSAMIKKVAEVLALKKCYTITGLYAPEEMGLQEPIDITNESNNWQQGPSQYQTHGDSRYDAPQPTGNGGGHGGGSNGGNRQNNSGGGGGSRANTAKPQVMNKRTEMNMTWDELAEVASAALGRQVKKVIQEIADNEWQIVLDHMNAMINSGPPQDDPFGADHIV